jgi:dTDP-4-amino-4,6-dideoxygalactose transaminase
MKRVIEARASTILFKFLINNQGLLRNGKFLLPANICPIIPVVFSKAKVFFEFLDISPQTQSLDQDAVYSRIQRDPDTINGVLFVHSYGYKQNISSLFKTISIKWPEKILIDDQCSCIPDINGESISKFSSLTLFSTGYAKHVEFGKGGFGFLGERAIYKDYREPFNELAHQQLVEQMKFALSNDLPFKYQDVAWLKFDQEFSEKDYFNKIKITIPEALKCKQRINRIYAENLPSEIHLGSKFTWRFNLQVSNKEKILNKIFENGLFASSHYKPLSSVFGGEEAPVADRFYKRMINLFNDHRFNEEMAFSMCKIIKKNII